MQIHLQVIDRSVKLEKKIVQLTESPGFESY